MTCYDNQHPNPQQTPHDRHDDLVGEYPKPEPNDEIIYEMCCNSTGRRQHSSKAKDGKKAERED
jgi:hypothetical protein